MKRLLQLFTRHADIRRRRFTSLKTRPRIDQIERASALTPCRLFLERDNQNCA